MFRFWNVFEMEDRIKTVFCFRGQHLGYNVQRELDMAVRSIDPHAGIQDFSFYFIFTAHFWCTNLLHLHEFFGAHKSWKFGIYKPG